MAMYTEDYTDEKPVLYYARKYNKAIILKKLLSSGHNKNIEDALRFSFGHKGTNAVIIGTINPNHIRQNV